MNVTGLTRYWRRLHLSWLTFRRNIRAKESDTVGKGSEEKYNFTFIPHGIIRTHKWPALSVIGFKAQLFRTSHRYREVTGSNSVEILHFSGFYIRFCFNNCEDHSLLDFTSAVQYMIYFIYNFTYYSTVMSFYHIRSREGAKYKAVTHRSALV